MKFFIDHLLYQRGVVVAYNLTNGDSSKELIAALRKAEVMVRKKFDINSLPSQPNIAAWREALRKYGAKPGDYHKSVELMLRRVLHFNELPNINMLVDIGNIISIKHMLPVGVHAIDLVNSDILVHKATGARLFNLLDPNNLNIHYKEKLSLLREKPPLSG